MPELQRKQVRLPNAYYLGYRAYFVTVCAKERRRIFESPSIVQSLLEILREQSVRHCFDVYAYCFMPDHCHFLMEGKALEADLSAMVRGFKGGSSVVLRKHGIGEAWQKGFYEHILRTDEDRGSVAAYIFENPVRAGLANDMYAWPFSGSFVFEWREFRPPLERFVPPNKVAEMREGANNGEDNPR